MPYAPQTALRNRRLHWGATPHRMGGDQLSRPRANADTHADTHGGNRRDPNGCTCSDHCAGVAGHPDCRGTAGDADDSAHGAAALDGRAAAADANCYTARYLDTDRCCGDSADCAEPDCGAARAADGTA